jgi:hypothetical protein
MWPSRTTIVSCRTMFRTALGVWLACVLLSGCGRDGPRRIPIEGTATLHGAPVEEALISFLPAAGRPGPAANAIIEAGKYRLGSDDGPAAGLHKVIVLAEADDKAAFFAAEGNQPSPKAAPSGRWEFEVEVPDKGPFQYNVTLD